MMKPIKFDLPLNGTKIATLDQLEENLTPEILEPFHSGKLAKWLRVRKLDEQAEAVEALISVSNENEVKLFKRLCEIFVSDVDENDAREAMQEYKAASPSQNSSEEVEELKAEIEALNAQIETLKAESEEIKKLSKNTNNFTETNLSHDGSFVDATRKFFDNLTG